MLKLKLVFTEFANSDIQKLDPVVKKRIGKKLDYYRNLDDPISTAEKLVSSKIGTYRWRVGDYRIVFDVNGNNIAVLRARHRREVYRYY